MTSSAYSRPRARPRRRVGPGRPGWASRSTIGLALAPTSDCPHCGRNSKTVQGVCADCWGSKGGRPLGARRQRPRTASLDRVAAVIGFDPLHPIVLAVTALVIPALIALVLWTLA